MKTDRIYKVLDKATSDNKSVNKVIKVVYVTASIIILTIFIISKI